MAAKFKELQKISIKVDMIEAFLGNRWFSAIKNVLDEVGVVVLEGFIELKNEEVDMLVLQMVFPNSVHRLFLFCNNVHLFYNIYSM